MFRDNIFGLLILIASKRTQTSVGALAELLDTEPIQLTYSIAQIEEFCASRSLPPITALLSESTSSITLSEIWNFDWNQQEIPESDAFAVEHSAGGAYWSKIRRGSEAAYDAAVSTLDRYWPKLVSLVKERLGPATFDLLRNDETVERFATLVYPLLPSAVRLIVREKDFVKFSLAQKQKYFPNARNPS